MNFGVPQALWCQCCAIYFIFNSHLILTLPNLIVDAIIVGSRRCLHFVFVLLPCVKLSLISTILIEHFSSIDFGKNRNRDILCAYIYYGSIVDEWQPSMVVARRTKQLRPTTVLVRLPIVVLKTGETAPVIVSDGFSRARTLDK